jgi:hypothetical protein
MNLDFWVPGIPKTKGSVTARPNHSIDHGDAVYERQKDIATAAQKEMARIGWVKIKSPMALFVSLATFVPYNSADANRPPNSGMGTWTSTRARCWTHWSRRECTRTIRRLWS